MRSARCGVALKLLLCGDVFEVCVPVRMCLRIVVWSYIDNVACIYVEHFLDGKYSYVFVLGIHVIVVS